MMNQNQEFRVYTLTQMETSDFDHIDLFHFILHFIFCFMLRFHAPYPQPTFVNILQIRTQILDQNGDSNHSLAKIKHSFQPIRS